MKEEKMKDYLLNGGELFHIKYIDTIRDGGTKMIETTRGSFFVNKDSKKFHHGYPTSDENLITNFLLIEYLLERIETYIKRCEEDVQRKKNLLLEIKKNN